jgi:hypothetical protein
MLSISLLGDWKLGNSWRRFFTTMTDEPLHDGTRLMVPNTVKYIYLVMDVPVCCDGYVDTKWWP